MSDLPSTTPSPQRGPRTFPTASPGDAVPWDALIIGAGVVGLATAYELTRRFPGWRIAIVEKESHVAAHQTGRNSGVIHSGIYYKPGSLKATHCREGKRLLEDFCATHQVAFETCGKVIVAVDDGERPALQRIFERGQANGVRCEMIGPERLQELEPHTQGVAAIHVPESGIVDYRGMCDALAQQVLEAGDHRLAFDARVTRIEHRGALSCVTTAQGEFLTRLVVNCAGLYCDRVSQLAHLAPAAKIVPFRGEYFELKPDREFLCRNLIYPVPDPKFPFLGVHFTRMVTGGVECGPNAVLAFAREGYRLTDVNMRDLCESLTYPGFLKMSARHWQMGLGEMWRSVSKSAFVRALQRLMPEIRAEDLQAAPSGVRAQALTPQGELVDDFLILEDEHTITVNNAPSPAATASLKIAQTIVDRIAARS